MTLDRLIQQETTADGNTSTPLAQLAPPRSSGASAQPIVKWAGGKRQLVPALMQHVPATYRRYYEPFIGGGALFFHLRPADAVLGDAVGELVRTYEGVRDDVADVVARLGSLRDDEQTYLAVRAADRDGLAAAAVAAQVIFLLKTCFNGLWRTNMAGRMNTPYAAPHGSRTICDTDVLTKASQALRSADLRIGDFAATLVDAGDGDLVYLDPPYDSEAKRPFTSYARVFTRADQRRVRDVAVGLAQRGARVIISNADTPFIRDLYQGFAQYSVHAARNISCKPGGRAKVPELILVPLAQDASRRPAQDRGLTAGAPPSVVTQVTLFDLPVPQKRLAGN